MNKTKKMPTLVFGDLLAASDDYICHQVNCRGAFGAGIAKQIKEKYPDAVSAYTAACWNHGANENGPLGKIATWVNPQTGQTIVHVFSQKDFGRDRTIRYTSYDALADALNALKRLAPFKSRIAFPWNFGCCLGNGDWKIVRAIIEAILVDNYKITYYTLDKMDFMYASGVDKY